MESILERATAEYLARQSRASHPAGKFDKAGRFFLADSERSECCRSIRCPSRAWPYSEMVHGRTAEHVAEMFGVDAREIRRLARHPLSARRRFITDAGHRANTKGETTMPVMYARHQPSGDHYMIRTAGNGDIMGVIGPLQRALYDSITLAQIEYLAQIAEHLDWSTEDARWADTQKWDVCYVAPRSALLRNAELAYALHRYDVEQDPFIG